MTMTMLEAAARDERTAEQNRKTAEAHWRKTWWRTTLELGAIKGGNGEAAQAVATVVRVLGQSERYVKDRRSVGVDLSGLEHTKIMSLPPRLTMEYLRSGRDPQQTIEVVSDAEARELSLRDFAAELGTQGAQWQRDKERRQNPLAGLTAAEKAEAARGALADPEVADLAFNRRDQATPQSPTQQILGNISHARNVAERQRLADRQANQSDTSRHINQKIGEAGAKLSLDESLLAYKRACREFTEAIAEALPQAGTYGGATHGLSLAALLGETVEQHGLAATTLEALDHYVSGAPSLHDEVDEIRGGRGAGH